MSSSGRSLSPSRTISPGGFSSLKPPFGLDFDLEDQQFQEFEEESLADDGSVTSASLFEESLGYREGGPKEARLRRVEIVGAPRELDHFVPLKFKVNTNKYVNALMRYYTEELADVPGLEHIYIPTDPHNGKPSMDFGVLRFTNHRYMEEAREKLDKKKTINKETTSLMAKQKTTFSRNTGALGLTSQPVGEIAVIGKVVMEQNVAFDTCYARNGAPWSSCRELKFLAPHKGAVVMDKDAIKISNIPKHLTTTDIEEYFKSYGKIIDVKCPKPMQVNLRVEDPNVGIAFIRFNDKRDMKDALQAMKEGKIEFDGMITKGEHVPPLHWPNDKSRRYY